MRLKSVLRMAWQYLPLAIAAVLLFGLLFLVGYFVIYKWLLKGTRKPSKTRLLLYALTIGYVVIVLGAVLIDRGFHFRYLNLFLFSSYKEAWNQWVISGWRNIILNILMFVPFGFLLPLWSKRLQKLWQTALAALIFSLLIEVLQYIGRLGVSELDDVFNNTLGAVIGYGFAMIFITIIDKKKLTIRKTAAYLAPLVFTIMAFGGIFIAYSTKELGNLRVAYSYTLDMDNTTIATEVKMSQNSQASMVYKTPIAGKKEADNFAESFFASLGTSVDKELNDYYDDTAVYYSENRKSSLWVEYKGLAYSYNGRAWQDEKKVLSKDAKEETIRSALAGYGIKIPQEAEFSTDGDGYYTFMVNMLPKEEGIMDGVLRCQYYGNGALYYIDNGLVTYEPYKEFDILSEAEAFDMVRQGKFYWYKGTDFNVSNISIETVELYYMLDSKGYYQPVYSFSFEEEGETSYIDIPAIR